MISIKDQDFELDQVKESDSFTLKLLSIVNAGKENERSEMKAESYTMTFDRALKKIVSIRLSKINKTVSVSEYLELYKAEIIKIGKLIKEKENETIKPTN